jgi:hypothetical protein
LVPLIAVPLVAVPLEVVPAVVAVVPVDAAFTAVAAYAWPASARAIAAARQAVWDVRMCISLEDPYSKGHETASGVPASR